MRQANVDEKANDEVNGEKKTAVIVGRQRRLKRSLGDQIREASKRNKLIIGKYETVLSVNFIVIKCENLITSASFSAELNRLWNLCPDNMAACRSKDRDFLPTLENYFGEAIEQLDPSVESQYKY